MIEYEQVRWANVVNRRFRRVFVTERDLQMTGMPLTMLLQARGIDVDNPYTQVDAPYVHAMVYQQEWSYLTPQEEQSHG